MKTVAVVGAGLSGATAAIILARNGFDVEVFEKSDRVGGNCATERCKQTGVQLHLHGPHIFHTNNSQVWEFVNNFAEFQSYTQRTKAISRGQLFSFPINLHTLSQLFGFPMTPDRAKDLIRSQTVTLPAQKLNTMEGWLLSTVGSGVYETFFRDYTLKQWGRHPVDLPASIAQRIPIRYNFDDRAFTDAYQGIPTYGYSHMIESMLNHSRIKVRLNEDPNLDYTHKHAHTIYTGPLDEAFRYQHGTLPYRTLKIAHEVRPENDALGASVINYCDDSVSWTRATEHKHFTPWEAEGTFGTVVSREFPEEWHEQSPLGRYYPVRLAQEEQTLLAYEGLARRCDTVTFMGRLGKFQYLNMDQAVMAAIAGTKEVIRKLA